MKTKKKTTAPTRGARQAAASAAPARETPPPAAKVRTGVRAGLGLDPGQIAGHPVNNFAGSMGDWTDI